ncbi:MAG TPA: DUF4034 domain-containing protein [Ramlibacter sp.]
MLLVFGQVPAMAAATQPAAADACAALDFTDEDASLSVLRRLYHEEQFAELDAALDCLLQDQRRFSSGKPSSAIAYLLFRRQMMAPGATPADLQRVQRWAQQRPQSMFAEFAALRLRYAFAWNIRGGGFASQITEAQMRGFTEGMAATEEALRRASPTLREASLWHQMLLAVAGDHRLASGDMGTVFQEAVKRWPTNYDLHEVLLTRLVPLWGGSWEHVDGFIQHYAGQQAGPERDALYARLYAGLLVTMREDPRRTRVDWPRMKRGLEALASRYPEPRHLNLAASFACVYRDAAYLKSSLARITPERRRPGAWLHGTDLNACQ